MIKNNIELDMYVSSEDYYYQFWNNARKIGIEEKYLKKQNINLHQHKYCQQGQMIN